MPRDAPLGDSKETPRRVNQANAAVRSHVTPSRVIGPWRIDEANNGKHCALELLTVSVMKLIFFETSFTAIFCFFYGVLRPKLGRSEDRMDIQGFFRAHPELLKLPERYRKALPEYLRWMPPAFYPISKFELNALMKQRGVPFAQDKRFLSRCAKRFVKDELFGQQEREPQIIWRLPRADLYGRALRELDKLIGDGIVNEAPANSLPDEEDE